MATANDKAGVIRLNAERRERAVESGRAAVGRKNGFRVDFLIEPMHSAAWLLSGSIFAGRQDIPHRF
jgi:hypothetical protein